MVPASYPEPVAVQLTLPMEIVSDPDVRSPLARHVRVVVRLEPVRVLEVTERGLTLAGTEGTLSGFESRKLKAKEPNSSFALAARFTDRVNVRDTTSPAGAGTVSLRVISFE